VDYETPERAFDRRWAQTVLRRVLDLLAGETQEQRFEVLKGFLLDDKGAVSYEAAAGQLGLSVAAVTSAIHRMRGRFRAIFQEEIAHPVERAEDLEPEVRPLLAALSD
jgi:DNA-directed RNA polymerase specialized sigma24 family protein